MKLINHVFVATDLSSPSLQAIERGFDISRITSARCTVMHALGLNALGSLQDLIGDQAATVTSKLVDKQRNELHSIISDTARNRGVAAEILVEEGLPAAAIPACAASTSADLVIAGSRGDNALRRLLIGSTASHLLRKCHCPVLIVKTGIHGSYKKALLAIDFSPASELALRITREIAPDAGIVLFHAFDVPFEGLLNYAGVTQDDIKRYRHEACEKALHLLHELARSAGLTQDQYHAQVECGDATRAILNQAERQDCDLIVMGKHGTHVTEELLLGSVTKQVLDEAPTDLLVIVDARSPELATLGGMQTGGRISGEPGTEKDAPPSPPFPPPAHLLLATDLSPRCDRALERSIQLAQAWQSHLTALNVFDVPGAPDQILAWAAGDQSFDLQHDARHQLNQDLANMGSRADIRLVHSAAPADSITLVARQTGAGLVITGVARDEPLGRFLLGSTVEKLSQTLEQPLLIVRNRVHGPYRNIVAVTDLSRNSSAALLAAAQWFPQSAVDVFFAHERPKAMGSAPESAALKLASSAVHERCERFVTGSGIPRLRIRHIVPVDEALETSLTRYVRRHAIDLVVMGSSENTGLFDTLFKNSLNRVLQWISSDVLVVPAADKQSG
ncbi:MAG: hypothetical protein DU480_10605 [Nitrosomonas sp.]|uniref:universal stress protein n=1 Tax=Nitrosomonas sp. TaxID=42353 RepID=UPI0032EC3A14